MCATQTSFFSNKDKNKSKSKATLLIKDFGKIRRCELDLTSLIVLMGQERQNRSTIARCIYFFKTVKDVLRDVVVQGNPSSDEEILDIVSNQLLMKFRLIFDPSDYSGALMHITYCYSEHVSLEVLNIAGELRMLFSPNMVAVLKSEELYALSSADLQYCLNTIFNDERECIFIPAERCITSVLSDRMIRLYAQMAHEGEERLDHCMVEYMEHVLQSREPKSQGAIVEQMTLYSSGETSVDKFSAIASMLLGENYIYSTDVSNNSVAKPSRGMKDLLNILFNVLAESTKTYIIVEEPEDQLCPNLQYEIVKLLALLYNVANSKLFLTTQSPYILTSLDTLMRSCQIEAEAYSQDHVVDKYARINTEDVQVLAVDEEPFESVLLSEEEFITLDTTAINKLSRDLESARATLTDKNAVANL